MVIWKDVEGFEGLYKVSNEGVLMSLPRNGTKGGVVKQREMKHGYIEYLLYKDGKMYHKLAHRLVAQHFIPNPENKPCVNHIDGRPTNNKLDNLEWVTYSENVLHALGMGLAYTIGESHPNTKLTNKEVFEIRELYKHKIYNQIELGKIYGVFQGTISLIVRNKSRKVVNS